MSERQPPDIEARRKALDPARSFIVQAPAGSGKTSLLTDRILALLSRVEQPEQIVAMTFTRKAAAEMHSRVMEKLELAQCADEPVDEHERQAWLLAREALAQDQHRGWNILQHPSRLRIQTIDSFCASIVRGMPWLSGLGGMPKIVENAAALHELAARRVVEAAGSFGCVRELLVHLDLNIELAVSAMADMLAKRDQWLPLLSHGEDAEQLQAFLQETMQEQLSRLDASLPLGWQTELAPAARLAAQTLSEQQDVHALSALTDWQAGGLQPEVGQLGQWKALAALLLTSTGSPRLKVDKRLGFPPNSKQKDLLMGWLDVHATQSASNLWAPSLAAVRAMPQPTFTDEQWRVLTAQLQCLRLAVAQLWLVFAELGEVDFIEVSQRAVSALGHDDRPSDLLLKLDQQISHLLVDEFQDTSAIQLRLLELLTSGWQSSDGRTLFLVGDPMQSIYRFRKAEVELFLKVQAKGIGDVILEPLVLTTNFRSQGGIVAWVNQTFGQMFPAVNEPEFGAIRYEPASAWHSIKAHDAVRWHLGTAQSNAWDAVVHVAERAWQTYANSDKPMGILVRSRNHLGDVVRRLQQANLPCRAVELDRLESRGTVVDLLQLTRALVHRGDRAAWLAVLRAPWCGLTLGTLHACFADASRAVCDVLADLVASDQCPGSIEQDQWQRLRATAVVLLNGFRQDDGLPFVARLEGIWRALEGDRLCSDSNSYAEAQSYLQLLDRLATFDTVDIDEVQRQLSLLYAQTQESGRAIEVMTMHKAKGLEFDVVVLLGLDRKPPPDRSPLVRVEQHQQRVVFGPIKARYDKDQDPLSSYLASRERRRIAHETDRLLYVAATRARQELHLIATGKIDQESGFWAEPVQSSLLARLWPFKPELPTPDGMDLTEAADEPVKPYWQAPPLRRRALPLEPGPWLGLTTPLGFDRYRWPEVETAERLTGILIHAWLAQYGAGQEAVAHLTLPDQAILQRQLRALGLPAPLREAAADEVVQALHCVLQSERGQWLLSQPLRKVEWALIDARQTISIIDLAIDLGDRWLVVDYKNSRRGEHEPVPVFTERMKARYGGQMARYREQLQQFDGRAVQTALFFPIEDLWVEVV